jgi:hypothetical protein
MNSIPDWVGAIAFVIFSAAFIGYMYFSDKISGR